MHTCVRVCVSIYAHMCRYSQNLTGESDSLELEVWGPELQASAGGAFALNLWAISVVLWNRSSYDKCNFYPVIFKMQQRTVTTIVKAEKLPGTTSISMASMGQQWRRVSASLQTMRKLMWRSTLMTLALRRQAGISSWLAASWFTSSWAWECKAKSWK